MEAIQTTTRVVGTCPLCGKEWHLDVDTHSYIMWKNRMCLIQDAFPDMEPSERELLISGICNDCWQTVFNPEDEEESLIARFVALPSRRAVTSMMQNCKNIRCALPAIIGEYNTMLTYMIQTDKTTIMLLLVVFITF